MRVRRVARRVSLVKVVLWSQREKLLKQVGIVVMLAFLVLAAALPATAAPLAGLHYLVGTWNCTYRAGAVHLAYANTYAYDRDGHTLRQVASWAGGGGDEELLAYDAKRGWSAVVFDDQGTATILRATGSDQIGRACVGKECRSRWSPYH